MRVVVHHRDQVNKYQESPLIRGGKRPVEGAAELFKKGRLSTATNYRTNENAKSP